MKILYPTQNQLAMKCRVPSWCKVISIHIQTTWDYYIAVLLYVACFLLVENGLEVGFIFYWDPNIDVYMCAFTIRNGFYELDHVAIRSLIMEFCIIIYW